MKIILHTLTVFIVFATSFCLHADTISGKDLYWKSRYVDDGDKTALDQKTIYSYLDGAGGWTEVQSTDTVVWDSCNIYLTEHPGPDWISWPTQGDLTVANMTINIPRSNFGYMWVIDSFQTYELNVTQTFTVNSNVYGSDDRKSGIVAGKIVIENLYAVGAERLNVGLGGNVGATDASRGFRYIWSKDDMEITGDTLVNMNSRYDQKRSDMQVEFQVDGVLKMQGNDTGTPTFQIRWFDAYYVDGIALHYLNLGGIDGVGTISTNKWGMNETGKALFTLNNSGVSDFKGKIDYVNPDGNPSGGYTARIDNMSLDFTMNGSGAQYMRISSDSTWGGKITVENGGFYLSTSSGATLALDVEVQGGAKFGAVNADKKSVAAEDYGNASLKTLSLKDGAILVFNGDNTSSIATAHSSIYVAETFSIENEFAMHFNGNIAEGDTLENIFTWEAAYAAENWNAIFDAYEDGKISLFVNGVEYLIDTLLDNGSNGVNITVGSIIPEPAAFGAVICALALAVALRRRIK